MTAHRVGQAPLPQGPGLAVRAVLEEAYTCQHPGAAALPWAPALGALGLTQGGCEQGLHIGREVVGWGDSAMAVCTPRFLRTGGPN